MAVEEVVCLCCTFEVVAILHNSVEVFDAVVEEEEAFVVESDSRTH